MTTITRTVSSSFHEFIGIFTENHDPKTESWLLMNPVHIFAVLATYLSFILFLGPKLMQNRPPMNIKKVMVAYNIIQIIVNLYFIQESMRQLILPGHLNLFCEGDSEYFQSKIELVKINVHLFYLSRVFDLLDTVFMVLKKKDRQLSFLHIYHHLLMGTLGWIGVYTGLGTRVMLFGTLNCTVHAIMYFYYLLTVLSPEYKKSVWWKKHITQMQLIQFLIVVLQLLGSFANPTCPTNNKIAMAVFFPQLLFILTLFIEFYYRTYIVVRDNNKTD